MSSEQNKHALQAVFQELARGNGRPFVDLMDEDFSWTIAGHSPWSQVWRGKQRVREELFGPLFARFDGTYRNQATRFVAEGDVVVVECRGDVMTKSGQRYHNVYCYVCEFRDARLHALTEYMDTAHAMEALGAL